MLIGNAMSCVSCTSLPCTGANLSDVRRPCVKSPRLAFAQANPTTAAHCLLQWPPVVESLRESSAPLPASVQQAFRQHEKSAKVMLLPAIKCACAAIDLQLFLWRYDRLGLPLLGCMASAASLISLVCSLQQPPALHR